MQQKRLCLITAVFLFVSLFGALSAGHPGKNFFPKLFPATENQKRPTVESRLTEPSPRLPPDGDQVAVKESRPSGPVDEPVPWTAGAVVEIVKHHYNTPVLVAAYRASLPEPIHAERFNIALAANMLAGTVVQPGEVFSQNGRIGPYNRARGFKDGPMYAGNRIVTSEGGGVCKIASLLYNVVILADLPVIERHPHSMTVPYVPPGQDATVAYGVCDFRFKNINDGPLLIWSEMIGETLYIAFYGQKAPPPVKWRHQIIRRLNFWTEYRYNAALSAGTEKVLTEGQEGIVVHSWLTIGKEGETATRDLGVDYYQPCPRVVERGPSKQHQTSTGSGCPALSTSFSTLIKRTVGSCGPWKCSPRRLTS